MNRTINISDETIARLKMHAEPLVDTFDSIINRAIDSLEGMEEGEGEKIEDEAPHPPRLRCVYASPQSPKTPRRRSKRASATT